MQTAALRGGNQARFTEKKADFPASSTAGDVHPVRQGDGENTSATPRSDNHELPHGGLRAGPPSKTDREWQRRPAMLSTRRPSGASMPQRMPHGISRGCQSQEPLHCCGARGRFPQHRQTSRRTDPVRMDAS